MNMKRPTASYDFIHGGHLGNIFISSIDRLLAFRKKSTRSIGDPDIIKLRRQGRPTFDTFVIDTVDPQVMLQDDELRYVIVWHRVD